MPDRWDESAGRLAAETLISVRDATKLIPPCGGRRCSPTTVRAWIIAGKSGVYLDGIRAAGAGWFTSADAIKRFWAQLSRAEVSAKVAAEQVVATCHPETEEALAAKQRADKQRVLDRLQASGKKGKR